MQTVPWFINIIQNSTMPQDQYGHQSCRAESGVVYGRSAKRSASVYTISLWRTISITGWTLGKLLKKRLVWMPLRQREDTKTVTPRTDVTRRNKTMSHQPRPLPHAFLIPDDHIRASLSLSIVWIASDILGGFKRSGRLYESPFFVFA